ncbi:BTB/POZ domain-containing protein [Dirofilaria immitis]
MSTIDIETLFEHNNNGHRNSDQDHTYCSINDNYNVPLAQRLTHFRNERVGCDVEFIVGMEQKSIHAHKLVLGCSSKVFAAMFYGKMTQQRQDDNLMTVIVPDVTPHAFATLVNFLYSDLDKDAVKLDDDNVMQTLYAAKKYDVKALILTCVRYLLDCLTASNAFCLLSQARFFDEPFLIKRCLQVIDTNTDEALKSSAFRDIDRDTLATVLGRDELDPTNELVIFKAAQSWSEAECERREIEVNPSNQREVLGPVLSLIRFPLMTVHEFGEAAVSSLLSCEEIAQVFLHLTVVPRPPVSYPTGLRCNGRSRHVVKRFPVISSKRYNRRENKFCFMVDREILISGFGIFGFAPITRTHSSFHHHLSDSADESALDWQTQVEIQILPPPNVRDSGLTISSTSVVETVVIQGTVGDIKPVVASFRKPVLVRPNIFYVAGMKFLSDGAVQTYGGKEGIGTATVSLPFDEEVNFNFQSFRNSYGSEDNSRCEGQLPEIHFFVQWAEGTH